MAESLGSWLKRLVRVLPARYIVISNPTVVDFIFHSSGIHKTEYEQVQEYIISTTLTHLKITGFLPKLEIVILERVYRDAELHKENL